MAKKVAEPKEKYEKKFNFIVNNIVEIKRATKRKHATIKVIVPDDLAESLMKDALSNGLNDLEITALGLSWNQLKKE